MSRPRKQLKYTIVCEDFSFAWTEADIEIFREDWNEGLDIEAMAEKYNRRWEECFFLIVDQLEQKLIKHRPGGIFGGK